MLLAVASLAAVLAVVGVASAVDAKQGIDVTLSATKAGTKAKPKSAGAITVLTTTEPGPNDPAGTFATKQATIFFDKNIVFGGSKFKSCATTVASSIDSKCLSSRIGSGKAKGQATIGGPEDLSIKAYNAGKGQKLYLHVTGNQPLKIDSVIVASLKTATGDYGRKLVVPIPAGLQEPLGGVKATLLNFSTKVSGTSKGTPYVGLKGCTGGKLKFKGTFAFTDGTSQTVTDSVKCSK
jgi:hypothetical protein